MPMDCLWWGHLSKEMQEGKREKKRKESIEDYL
jgi:hypothetical protein